MVPLWEPSTSGAGAGTGRLAGLLGSVWVSCGHVAALQLCLPSQLNITTRSARDGSVLEMERLRLSGSVTEHRLPEHGPGSSYVVTMRGLTAAGAGAASLWEFPTNSSGNARPVPVAPG